MRQPIKPPVYRKGSRVRFLRRDIDVYGNVSELRDACRSSGQRFRLFLTDANLYWLIALESDWPERGREVWERPASSVGSGALRTVRENRRERMSLMPGRTHNRSRSPR